MEYVTDPETGIVTVIDDSGQAVGVLSPAQPPLEAPPSPPASPDPTQPPEDTTQPPPEAPPPPQVDYWDANTQTWHQTGMALGDTQTNVGGQSVNIPGVISANQSTPMLYRVDGKILDKPPSIEGYDSPYPATLPEGYTPPKATPPPAGSITPPPIIVYENQIDPTTGKEIQVMVLYIPYGAGQTPIIPEGAEVVSRDANNNPLSVMYQGIQYWLPGSIAYEQGFRTEDERIQHGGEGLGLGAGSLIPAVTLVIVDASGKPIRRVSIEQARMGVGDIAGARSVGQLRYAVRDYNGNDVLVMPEQYDKLAAAETDDDRLAISKELGIVPKDMSLKEFTGEVAREAQAKASAEAFVSQQEYNRFIRLNTELPDGKWVNTQALADIQKQSPQLYQILTTQGIEAANRYIDEEAAKPTLKIIGVIDDNKDKPTSSLIKDIWRQLTPWDEEAGQTYLQYMSKYPERVKQSFKENVLTRQGLTQDELKARYDANEAARKDAKSLPLWARILFTPPQDVSYDAKTDKYLYLVLGEVPSSASGKARAAQQVAQAARTVTTIAPKDVGMSEQSFAQFLKARVKNPDLTPDNYKAREIIERLPHIDWKKVTDALERGEIESVSKLRRVLMPRKEYADRENVQFIRNIYRESAADWRQYLRDFSKRERNANLSIIREGGRPSKDMETAFKGLYGERWREVYQQSLKEAEDALIKSRIVFSPRTPQRQLIEEPAVLDVSKLSTNQESSLIQSLAPQTRTLIGDNMLTDLSPQVITELEKELAVKRELARILSNVTSAEPDIKLKTELVSLTEAQVKSLADEGLQEKVALEIQALALPQLKTKLQEATQSQPKTEIKLQVKPIQGVGVTPIIKPSPINRPPIIKPPPIKPPSIKHPPSITLPKDEEQKKRIIKSPPPGTIVWIQGRPQHTGDTTAPMFKVLPPPYKTEDMFTTREIPSGYNDEGFTGKGMAFKSIQVLGGYPPSDIEGVDLGFAKVNIKMEAGKPRIEYAHDVESNTGDRSMTVGQGRGQIPIKEWEEAKAQGIVFDDFIASYKGDKNETEVVREAAQTEVDEEETPIEEPRSVRLRKPQKMANWWETPEYEPPKEMPYREPTYRGRRLLPPDLGATL